MIFSIASNTTRCSWELWITICTGRPPVEPGKAGSWKAKMLTPSISPTAFWISP
ncbi:hypothetical protein D9M71_194870 [compost metagenome]